MSWDYRVSLLGGVVKACYLCLINFRDTTLPQLIKNRTAPCGRNMFPGRKAQQGCRSGAWASLLWEDSHRRQRRLIEKEPCHTNFSNLVTESWLKQSHENLLYQSCTKFLFLVPKLKTTLGHLFSDEYGHQSVLYQNHRFFSTIYEYENLIAFFVIIPTKMQ